MLNDSEDEMWLTPIRKRRVRESRSSDDEPAASRVNRKKKKVSVPLPDDGDSSDSSSSQFESSNSECYASPEAEEDIHTVEQAQKPFECSNCGYQHVFEQYISPIPKHLLETNDPPLESEETLLRQIIEEADFQKDISQLDDGIARAELMLIAMKRRRSEIQASAIAAKGVVSPIRRVPKEIIIEIVLYALHHDSGTTLNVKQGPWVYSQVCRLWREEILSRRGIWSDISIEVPKEEKGCRHWPTVFDTLIERADPGPTNSSLTISIRLQSDSILAKELLHVALSTCTYWREAALVLPRNLLPRLKKLKGRIPQLQSIDIAHTSHGLIDSKCLVGVFHDAPELHRVKLMSFRDAEELLFSWSRLTNFCDGQNFNYSPTLLPRLTNLVSLTIPAAWGYSLDDPWPTVLGAPTLKLPYLRKLDLSFQANQRFGFLGDPESLVTFLDVPALEELLTPIVLLPMVNNLLQRSGCRLKSVSLSFSSSSSSLSLFKFEKPGNLTRFLEELVVLEKLDLSRLNLGPKMTEFFALLNGASMPRLKMLVIDRDVLAIKTACMVIMEMIEKRSLESVEFLQENIWSFLPSSWYRKIRRRYARFDRFREKGVRIWTTPRVTA
ncbi:hypothetical protein C8J56DRAFT_922495 [Mycena floridula]|nr:hypothetical protein C8J56DRAFT_922495 [Mycena floridula]